MPVDLRQQHRSLLPLRRREKTFAGQQFHVAIQSEGTVAPVAALLLSEVQFAANVAVGLFFGAAPDSKLGNANALVAEDSQVVPASRGDFRLELSGNLQRVVL
jgi:hypothetical protein